MMHTVILLAATAGAAEAQLQLPVGPMAPRHVARAPRPYFSWDTVPTSFHGARKDAAYTEDEVKRLAEYNVLCLEKWYVRSHQCCTRALSADRGLGRGGWRWACESHSSPGVEVGM